MTKQLLNDFAKNIVENGKISSLQAKKIFSLLSKSDLKILLEYVRIESFKRTAYVTVAQKIDKNTQTQIQALFPETKLIVSADGKIGAGVRIQVYDMIYDLTTKSEIKRVVEEIEEEL